MNRKQIVAAGVVLGMAAMIGCKVEESKDGKNDNVNVATPFGGMKVKTNEAGPVEGLGLPVYPGAELVKKNDKDNGGSADVNFSFGKFQLRVKAASYKTPDDQDKVTAFYRNALKQYGTVIACNHNQPIGTPTHTDEGLTCSDDDKGKHVNVNDSSSAKVELKAGSKQHQHIVGIEQDGTGTKFGLVALDLPAGFTGDGDSDARQ